MRQRWADEAFVRKACDAILKDVDWDSIDSGRLHRATSKATTKSGHPVIVGVLTDPLQLDALVEDAEEERRHHGLAGGEVWIYVPSGFAAGRCPANVRLVRVA